MTESDSPERAGRHEPPGPGQRAGAAVDQALRGLACASQTAADELRPRVASALSWLMAGIAWDIRCVRAGCRSTRRKLQPWLNSLGSGTEPRFSSPGGRGKG